MHVYETSDASLPKDTEESDEYKQIGRLHAGISPLTCFCETGPINNVRLQYKSSVVGINKFRNCVRISVLEFCYFIEIKPYCTYIEMSKPPRVPSEVLIYITNSFKIGIMLGQANTFT